MDRLTKEQIEICRIELKLESRLTHAEADTLCDLALQSLSQEAVRDEVLEEAARVCDAEALRATLCAGQLRGAEMAAATSTELAKAIRALKREPNAAGPVQRKEPEVMVANLDGAPAAPDVSSMVRHLKEASHLVAGLGLPAISGTCDDAAALLAKLGQGWIPVSERLPEGDEDILAASEKRLHVKPSVIIRNAMAAAKREGDVGFYTHWMPLPQLPGASDE